MNQRSQLDSKLFVAQADLVSVIIPTYNRAHLIQEAVDCVRRQTWKKSQIIVVDDGSTDETQNILQNMSDITYVRQNNKGPASARNTGLKLAQGEFLCTIDSDDLWNPNFLTESIQALRKLGVNLVFSNWIRQNSDGNLVKSFFETNYAWWNYERSELPHWRIISPSVIRATLLDSCIAPTSAWVFRRGAILDGWTESTKITDDWGLLQDIVLENPCRVAANMQRSWLKRAQKDSICDADGMHVRRAIYIDSPMRVLRAKSHLLTRAEKARLHRRIAANVLCISRDKNQSFITSSSTMTTLIKALSAAFANSPTEFLQKMFVRSTHELPFAPDRLLDEEKLTEALSNSLLRLAPSV